MVHHTFDVFLRGFDEMRVLVWHRATFGGLVAKPYTVAFFVKFNQRVHEISFFFGGEFFQIMYVSFWDEHQVVFDQMVIPHRIRKSVSDDAKRATIFYEIFVSVIECAKLTL